MPRQSLHPLLVGSNPQLVDGVTVFEPFLQYTRSQLPHLPLWDPYIMGGMPYLADMQSAIFSPFSLPAYVLPFWWSLGVIAVMKVVVAATGTYLLARALKMGQAGAFMAGLVFGFGLFLIAWIPWPLDNVFPLIPWMLYATERLVRRPGVLPASGLAALVALQFFGGHPESSVYALFAVVGYFVLRLLQGAGGGVLATVGEARRRGTSRLAALAGCIPRPVVSFVCALVVGTALAGVVLLPFLELLHNSSDLTARPRSQVHVQAKYVFAAFLPRYFPGSFEIETAFYAGALPLMLAFAALLRRVERVAVAVVGAASLLVVLGIQPLFALAGRTPGLEQTYLSRLTIIYLLCLALLAGWGLDDLVRRRPSRRVAVSIGALAVGPGAFAPGGGGRDPGHLLALPPPGRRHRLVLRRHPLPARRARGPDRPPDGAGGVARGGRLRRRPPAAATAQGPAGRGPSPSWPWPSSSATSSRRDRVQPGHPPVQRHAAGDGRHLLPAAPGDVALRGGDAVQHDGSPAARREHPLRPHRPAAATTCR